MGRGPAVLQLMDSGEAEDKSRPPLISEAVLVRGSCSTKISSREHNIVATQKARAVVEVARRYVYRVLATSLLRGQNQGY